MRRILNWFLSRVKRRRQERLEATRRYELARDYPGGVFPPDVALSRCSQCEELTGYMYGPGPGLCKSCLLDEPAVFRAALLGGRS